MGSSESREHSSSNLYTNLTNKVVCAAPPLTELLIFTRIVPDLLDSGESVIKTLKICEKNDLTE